MVVRYIQVTFVTIFALVVGLITTTNIKAETQGETWVINESPVIQHGQLAFNISFISNNEVYSQFKLWHIPEVETWYNIIYDSYTVHHDDSWTNQAYRTVTFETAPTGDLLTWLQANAVKQTVVNGGYTQADLDEAWADGYDAGVFTVYENGFAGIYNPYTGQFYTNENSYPYYNGYDAGVFTVYENGFGGIINPNTNEYYSDKDNYIYWLGVEDSNDFSFTGLLFQVFTGVGSVLTIELLPNVTLGAIVAVPIVFGIIYFILGKRKGD